MQSMHFRLDRQGPVIHNTICDRRLTIQFDLVVAADLATQTYTVGSENKVGPENKVGRANHFEIPEPSGSGGSIRLVKVVLRFHSQPTSASPNTK